MSRKYKEKIINWFDSEKAGRDEIWSKAKVKRPSLERKNNYWNSLEESYTQMKVGNGTIMEFPFNGFYFLCKLGRKATC